MGPEPDMVLICAKCQGTTCIYGQTKRDSARMEGTGVYVAQRTIEPGVQSFVRQITSFLRCHGCGNEVPADLDRLRRLVTL